MVIQFYVSLICAVLILNDVDAQQVNGGKGSGWSIFSPFSGLFSKSGAPSDSGTKIAADGQHRVFIDKTMREVKERIGSGNLWDASNLLLSVLEVDHENLEANSLIGACYLALSRPDLSEGFLYTAVSLSKWSDIVSVANLAESLRLNKDLVLASQVAVKGFNGAEAKDKSGHLQYVLGSIYHDIGNFKASAEWFLASAMMLQHPQAAATVPATATSSIDAWLRASTLQFPVAGRDYVFAENVLAEALKDNQDNSIITYYLGLVFHHTNRLTEAILFYKQALRLDPNNYDALSTLATAYHSQGNIQDALNTYQLAEARFPNNAILLANFALCLNGVGGNAQAAVTLATRSLSQDPSNKSAEAALMEARRQLARA